MERLESNREQDVQAINTLGNMEKIIPDIKEIKTILKELNTKKKNSRPPRYQKRY